MSVAKDVKGVMNLRRVLVPIANCGTFSRLHLPVFTGRLTNKINVDLDMLSDSFFAQKLSSFLSIICLLGIGKSNLVLSGTNRLWDRYETTYFGARVELS